MSAFKGLGSDFFLTRFSELHFSSMKGGFTSSFSETLFLETTSDFSETSFFSGTDLLEMTSFFSEILETTSFFSQTGGVSSVFENILSTSSSTEISRLSRLVVFKLGLIFLSSRD